MEDCGGLNRTRLKCLVLPSEEGKHVSLYSFDAVKLGIVLTEPPELGQALIDSGEKNVFAMDSTLESGDLSWGSRHFFAMVGASVGLQRR